jgi:uncharacterized membrane protein
MNKTFQSLLILFLLSGLIMIRQLTTDGYFSVIMNDVVTYTSWAQQFTEALKEGIMYPRWMPLSYHGYGAPVFILYPPLAFYLIGFFNMFTDSIIEAMNVTKFMALFLSAVGMFFLVKEFYSQKIALLTASLYLIFPYTIFQFYLVGQFASTISFIWFSPILLFTYRYLEREHVKHIIFAGICFAGLILTHLINAYMFGLIIMALILFMAIAQKKPKNLTATPLIILISFLISSAYVLPLIYENQFCNLSAFITEGPGYNYTKFFFVPKQTDQFLPHLLWPVYYKTYLFFVLFFITIVFLFLFQLLRIRAKMSTNLKSINIFFLCVAIFSIFILFGISNYLWKTIPFFKYIQFPTRWLNITTFTVVFLSAITFWSLTISNKSITGSLFLMIMLFLIFLILDFRYISTAYIVDNEKLMTYKTQNWNLEHLPVWAKVVIISDSNSNNTEILSGQGNADLVEWKSAKRIITISAKEALTVKIRTLYFPGWKAFLDGVEILIVPEAETGAMLIGIPKGNHILELNFVDTPIRYYAKMISFISLISLGCLLLVNKYQNKIAILWQKRLFGSHQ